MKIIKLDQIGHVEKQGQFGWEPSVIYEPIYIMAENIESFYYAGNTYMKMRSGGVIKVKESVDQILALLGAA
ncbi:hypothetical protein CHU32_03755 [Superficieibacter electus]|uniref:Uncharacterized protein n=1 Tax=Superficieibacter electus TaxID=2022662 RepID=A0A2P5GVG6_9ENTR|nr:hypothetical protein [Superficieibacter electus]POP42360.1 hypothetical protein CHU33_20040 [Superficieibacter electus]POP50549.1 hypothetical protein CHU32_03755 [Superficieibacter electus]